MICPRIKKNHKDDSDILQYKLIGRRDNDNKKITNVTVYNNNDRKPLI